VGTSPAASPSTKTTPVRTSLSSSSLSSTNPGYLVSLDEDSAELEDWNVFVSEGDLIVRTLLLTAEEGWNRERAVRTVMAAHRMEGLEEDPEVEALMWRFARGEISIPTRRRTSAVIRLERLT
jgi:hypothetical protein